MDWVRRNNLDETQYDPYLMLGASSERGDAIRRWAKDINNDFAARMQWTITDDYSEANHHPVAVVENDKTRDVVQVKIKPGNKLRLDASKSTDPDGDSLSYEWIYYKEASSYNGNLDITAIKSVAEIIIPADSKGKDFHIVLRVTDNGTPALTSYRRIIVNC